MKNILTIESNNPDLNILPFYADGYPGIMFQETENGLYVLPQNKKMHVFFLYGQTIHPIELQIEGKYKLIVFQLYPFVIESFFDINPRTLNNDCYDLMQLRNIDTKAQITKLKTISDFYEWINIISSFLSEIFHSQKEKLDYKIQQAVLQIIDSNGLLKIKYLREQLNISERTFERRFLAQVSITPKQFSKIIQFQNSLNDLQEKEFKKLSDIVYQNGFADQSHFIRVFKAYTGKTPKKFLS
ncbi:hypothetical protein BH11BAC7_BH11BAC7_30220 [soil metagenome]